MAVVIWSLADFLVGVPVAKPDLTLFGTLGRARAIT